VDLIDQSLHVPIAIRKLRWQQRPITFVGLPTVIHTHPGEAELLNHGQCIFHLGRSKCLAVTPRAPDGSEGALRRGVEAEAAILHGAAVVSQSLEVIALMYRHECRERFERLAGPQIEIRFHI
jgi:hypothetical protein